MCTSLNNLPKTIIWNWCSYGGFLFWRWHGQPFNGRLLGESCVWASGLSHQQTLSKPTFYRLASLVYGHSTQIGEGEIECPEKEGNGQSIPKEEENNLNKENVDQPRLPGSMTLSHDFWTKQLRLTQHLLQLLQHFESTPVRLTQIQLSAGYRTACLV